MNLSERKQQFSIILKLSFEWVFSLNALIFGIQIFVFISFWNNFNIFQVNDFRHHLSWLKTEGDHMSINLRLDWWLEIFFCIYIHIYIFSYSDTDSDWLHLFTVFLLYFLKIIIPSVIVLSSEQKLALKC